MPLLFQLGLVPCLVDYEQRLLGKLFPHFPHFHVAGSHAKSARFCKVDALETTMPTNWFPMNGFCTICHWDAFQGENFMNQSIEQSLMCSLKTNGVRITNCHGITWHIKVGSYTALWFIHLWFSCPHWYLRAAQTPIADFPIRKYSALVYGAGRASSMYFQNWTN